jgi:hypothetical protein
MNLNLNQIAMLQKFKNGLDRFYSNHPKLSPFINTVSKNALVEGTIIEINVTTPEGQSYCSNIKLKEDDIELMQTLQQLNQ